MANTRKPVPAKINNAHDKAFTQGNKERSGEILIDDDIVSVTVAIDRGASKLTRNTDDALEYTLFGNVDGGEIKTLGAMIIQGGVHRGRANQITAFSHFRADLARDLPGINRKLWVDIDPKQNTRCKCDIDQLTE